MKKSLPIIIISAVAIFSAIYYTQPFKKSADNELMEHFKEKVYPAYLNLIDVLLQQQGKLVETQQTLENVKQTELQHYFGKKSIAKQEVKIPELEEGTAVLYPVLLPERTELLLNFANSVCRIRIPVPGDEVSSTAKLLHDNIQNKASGRFIRQSRQLYDWLIKPIKPRLAQHKIETLITVPDGALRLIPMAGLFNGKLFLIHEYALATTPSLYLTNTTSFAKKNVQIMLNGLSESVQGFTPLENIPYEINKIKSLFIQSDAFLNQQFTLRNIEQKLEQTSYDIVHIASHGQFDPDPKKTFILTYDDKLTMDRLEHLLVKRDNQVDLLTLSACQTALGDEQAALGLAGVAIKAGARSALASLWAVNDESTVMLMQEFYQQLQQPNISKAKALQQAQIKVADDERFKHPAYWAPFLLIGNWGTGFIERD